MLILVLSVPQQDQWLLHVPVQLDIMIQVYLNVAPAHINAYNVKMVMVVLYAKPTEPRLHNATVFKAILRMHNRHVKNVHLSVKHVLLRLIIAKHAH